MMPGGAGTGPRFSVIITAYNRATFLPRAIDSVLRQTVARGQYEIIVVKNFADPESDKRIEEHGLVGLFRTEKDLGIHLFAALAVARGSIVAFVNDDDLWEPSKLEHVAQRFAEHPNLGFHATSYTIVDEEDRPVIGRRDRFAGLARFLAAPGAVFSVRPGAAPEELDRFVRAYPGSDSTVSIRTDILRKFGDDLAILPSSVDTFLLTCALLSGSDLMIEYLPLTRLRVHPENMSRATDESFASYRTKYARSMTGFARARRQMVHMAETKGDRWLVDRWTSDLRRLDHFSGMARGDLRRSEVLHSLATELRQGGPRRGLVASELLYLLSPRASQAANFLVGRRIAGA
ncbi:MAG: glycosyltransferase family 2 protein [Thermoplasmata archaeon]|nr:glycosyltransferase family 2 protein [Thermoplasmata archaeon]